MPDRPKICLDDGGDNADWLRTVAWRYPPYGTPEFARYLRSSATSLEDFKAWPVYRAARRFGLIDAKDGWTGEGMGWRGGVMVR